LSGERELVEPRSRAEWREWLAANGETSDGVWLVLGKPSAGPPPLTYDESVEEALCFGWIDSQQSSLDAERVKQLMTPRRRGGGWARTNKERIERLEASGLMTDAGRRVIEAAKADGSWTLLDGPEAGIVPDDLAEAFAAADPAARRNYDAFPPGARKQLLTWIATAKRPETRAKRIADAVARAAHNQRSP
jgi:uncharacterized protein YdeI (YjbR/CyaY-like superfamily)